MRDPDRLIYFKEEVGGLVMGGYEQDPIPWAVDGIPEGFNFSLLDTAERLRRPGHFDQVGWPDFGNDPHPCPDCIECAVITPIDINGDPTFPLDTRFAFVLTSDGSGAVDFRFLASGDPPGPKKEKRYHSEFVPLKDVIVDPDGSFTLVIREPVITLSPQTGPGDDMFISIGGHPVRGMDALTQGQAVVRRVLPTSVAATASVPATASVAATASATGPPALGRSTVNGNR